jgi:glycosyltransferase involved in cell wall biosynthesis
MNVAVVIPSYNASASLPALLERTLPFVPKERIIVVNDGSTDGTAAAAGAFGVTVLSHGVNRGKGAALRTGFDQCRTIACDAVITMDADLQHEPESIPRFISRCEETGSDIVIGSRMQDIASMPIHRRASNTITSALVRWRTGATISDSQSGYRCIRRRVLDLFTVSADGFEAETEFLLKAAAYGCSFSSVPIKTIYAGEKSHMTHVRTTVQFIRVLMKRY